MSEIKVGDTVVCIRGIEPEVKLGQMFKVTSVGSQYIGFPLDNLDKEKYEEDIRNGSQPNWGIDCFEVLKEEPSQSIRFNEGKLDWSQVHFKSLEPMVRVLMYGASKYPDNGEMKNWMNKMERNNPLNSAMRHLTSLMDGEELDESGESHAAHVMANMMFYIYHFVNKNE